MAENLLYEGEQGGRGASCEWRNGQGAGEVQGMSERCLISRLSRREREDEKLDNAPGP